MARRESRDHRLLVLGLLRTRDMHGYQIAETVAARFGRSVSVKTPTLYDTLKRMRAEGLVTSREEQEGHRPSRAVYALTPAGEQEFMRLLRDDLGTFREPELPGVVALAFVDELPPDEARTLLAARAEALLATIEAMLSTEVQGRVSRIVSSRRSHHLLAESAWMEEILADQPEAAVDGTDASS